MAVMKKSIADQTTAGAIVLDFGDLRGQADRILEEARTAAAVMMEEANDRAQVVSDLAAGIGQDAGYEAGYKKGRDEGQKSAKKEALAAHQDEFSELVVNWTAALEQFEHDRQTMLAGAKEDVLALAFEIAAKIVRRGPPMDSMVIVDQMEDTLELVLDASRLTVEVHPLDRPQLEDAWPQLTARLTSSPEARFLENDQLARGGLRVYTRHGHVDATISKQLDRIARSLLPDRNDDRESEA